MSFDDESAARELDLYAENESALYGQFKSIIANVKRKIESGKYDAAKAPKLWGYWYEAAARRYVKEFGGEVRTAFPASLRGQLAKERAKDEYQKIMGGEYGAVVVKTKTAKRSKPRRSSPKRSKGRRGIKRRVLTRLRRVRLAAGRRGFGVLRSQGKGTPFTLHPVVGDRVSWISRPWGMRCHGIVTGTSSSGDTLGVTQSNGTGGVIKASDVLAVNKREMLK
jgi:hypothetical protein